MAPQSEGELVLSDQSHVHSCIAAIAAKAVEPYRSQHTRRVYAFRISEFLRSGHSLTRQGVRTWLAELRAASQDSAGVQAQSLTAVKALAREAAEHELITPEHCESIRSLRIVSQPGTRLGNWLTQEKAAELYRLPDRGTLTGRRDAAILALILGCGLRREEACNLRWEHYVTRQNRAMLADFTSKRAKVRSVPVPVFAQADLDSWRDDSVELDRAAPSQRILGAMLTPGIIEPTLSPAGLRIIFRSYAQKIGFPNLAPHDCRRTLAQLMRQGGAEIEQIGAVLGHASIATTQRYLGTAMEIGLGKAATDGVML